jgi:hypothetical protein
MKMIKKYSAIFLSIALLASIICNVFYFVTIFNKNNNHNEKATKQVIKIDLSFISHDTLTEIKENPTNINDEFELNKEKLKQAIGSNLGNINDSDLFVIFCSVVSYKYAPYGNSIALDLEDLLNEKQLDCDNYCILAGELFELNKIYYSNLEMRFLGWNAGYVGNHAQIFTEDKGSGINLLIDPTVGVLAIATFDNVASGKKVNPNMIIDYSDRTSLNEYKDKIVDALIGGKYKPSDLLYYYENISQMLKYSKIIIKPGEFPPDWMTPGAMTLRNSIKKQAK